MNKTDIDWADYSINPIKGLCPMDCKDDRGKPYCYARRMYKRFKWNPEIRFDPNVMLDTGNIVNPSRIFVGSTMELFGDWVKPEWLKSIFDWVRTDIGKHTYIFLTKQPQNLIKWSPFPENCWVGVSITSSMDCIVRLPAMAKVSSKVKFVSFEPLLKPIASPNQLYIMLKLSGINWLIIGSQTQPTRHPPREWVDEIISAADNASIPVFVKEPLASHYGLNRKEMPKTTLEREV